MYIKYPKCMLELYFLHTILQFWKKEFLGIADCMVTHLEIKNNRPN